MSPILVLILITYCVYIYIYYLVPDTPNNLKINEISDTTATLQWDIPWILNGVLKMFVINVEEVAAIDMNTCCTNITPIEIQTDEEFPFYKYTVICIV